MSKSRIAVRFEIQNVLRTENYLREMVTLVQKDHCNYNSQIDGECLEVKSSELQVFCHVWL